MKKWERKNNHRAFADTIFSLLWVLKITWKIHIKILCFANRFFIAPIFTEKIRKKSRNFFLQIRMCTHFFRPTDTIFSLLWVLWINEKYIKSLFFIHKVVTRGTRTIWIRPRETIGKKINSGYQALSEGA